MDYEARDNNAIGDDWPTKYTIDPPDGSSATGYISLNVKSVTAGRGTFYIRH